MLATYDKDGTGSWMSKIILICAVAEMSMIFLCECSVEVL